MWENISIIDTIPRCNVLSYQILVKKNKAYLIPITQTALKITTNDEKKSKEALRDAFMKNFHLS